MATDVDALIQAVQATPTDEALRLVLADALDEAGRVSEADWLRFDVASCVGSMIDPFAFNQRERCAQPPGIKPLWDDRIRARTGQEPVNLMHRLQRRRRR